MFGASLHWLYEWKHLGEVCVCVRVCACAHVRLCGLCCAGSVCDLYDVFEVCGVYAVCGVCKVRVCGCVYIPTQLNVSGLFYFFLTVVDSRPVGTVSRYANCFGRNTNQNFNTFAQLMLNR